MDIMRKFKAVIFDLDDTLYPEIDYVISGFKVVSSIISRDYNMNQETIFKKMKSLFKIDTNNVFDRLLNSINVNYNKDYIMDLVENYRKHLPKIKIYEDADYIIKYLYSENYKLGIITDGYKIAQKNKLKALNINKYFDCIIITDELGKEYWKPHRKSYEIVKNSLKVKYQEMIYVGDNITKDFVAPNKLGITSVLISREKGVYYNINDVKLEDIYKPNYNIKTLFELKKILEVKSKG